MLCYADCTFTLGKAYYGDLSVQRYRQCLLLRLQFAEELHVLCCRRYRLSREPLGETIEGRAREFSFSGETITMMKFNFYQNSASAHDYDLIVGSENSNGSGTLRIYDGMSAEGDFSKVTPTSYSGFGKIVDAAVSVPTNHQL